MDEKIQAIVDFFLTPPPSPPPRVPAETLRQQWEATARYLNRGAPDWPVRRAVPVPGADPDVRLDLYPAGGERPGAAPLLLFIHGGSWVAGSPATHHRLTIRLAAMGLTVASLDYRRPPEHGYPASLDDCVAAACWLAENAGSLGADPARMAIAGDSAGGNLAAATVTRLLETGAPMPFRAALLIYGVYDFPSMLEIEASAPFVTGESFRLQLLDYPGEGWPPQRLAESGLSPGRSAALAGFPPSLLVAGTRDPLLRQSEDFSAALRAAGAQARLQRYDGMPHAFLQIEELPEARGALAHAEAFLGERLRV